MGNLVLLNDQHTVNFLGYGFAHLHSNLHVVVDAFEFGYLVREGLEVVVGVAVGIDYDLQNVHNIFLLTQTVDKTLIVGLLDNLAGDVDTLYPCAHNDGCGDIGTLLVTQILINVVEAGNRELFERVQVGVVFGHAAQHLEVEELTNAQTICQTLDG